VHIFFKKMKSAPPLTERFGSGPPSAEQQQTQNASPNAGARLGLAQRGVVAQDIVLAAI
jgi:hypothetical protein